jgi:2-polyprenyl-3-methyl-5-hydroxy-6-metoxy-1,4-benzoquinol methylase
MNQPMKNSNNLIHVNCCFCNKDESKVLYHKGAFRIVKCKLCGLIYTSPRLSDDALKALYDSHYYRSPDPLTLGYEDYKKDWYNIIKTFQKRWVVIEKHLSNKGRVLDIGCAYGYLLKYLKDEKYETCGIEMATDVAQYVRDTLGIEVHTKQLREMSFPDNYFDVIILWDVIEHFTNPQLELLEIYRILKPGGIFSVITPDSGSLQAKIWRGKWVEYLRPSEHLYFFSKKVLIEKISEIGFDVLDIRTAGKFVSIKFLVDRLKAYNRPFFDMLDKLVKILKLDRKVLYVDPKDKMFINFRKK